MTTNIERAADVIDRWSRNGGELNSHVGNPDDLAQALADAGLLIPENSTEQWLVQIGYRNTAGQTDIVEGSGNTREEAVANAQEQRMLPTATEVVRGFAKRTVSPWQPEAPIYAEQEQRDV